MQCTTASLLGYETLPPDTRVCELPPDRLDDGDVFINALHDNLPECDRATHAATLDDVADGASHCYVYCAQRACHAAVRYMTTHADELAQLAGTPRGTPAPNCRAS